MWKREERYSHWKLLHVPKLSMVDPIEQHMESCPRYAILGYMAIDTTRRPAIDDKRRRDLPHWYPWPQHSFKYFKFIQGLEAVCWGHAQHCVERSWHQPVKTWERLWEHFINIERYPYIPPAFSERVLIVKSLTSCLHFFIGSLSAIEWIWCLASGRLGPAETTWNVPIVLISNSGQLVTHIRKFGKQGPKLDEFFHTPRPFDARVAPSASTIR